MLCLHLSLFSMGKGDELRNIGNKISHNSFPKKNIYSFWKSPCTNNTKYKLKRKLSLRQAGLLVVSSLEPTGREKYHFCPRCSGWRMLTCPGCSQDKPSPCFHTGKTDCRICVVPGEIDWQFCSSHFFFFLLM